MEKTKEFNREEQTKYELHILIKEEIEKKDWNRETAINTLNGKK